MTTVAVVGDLHLGIAPNNSLKFEVLLESQISFFRECLIPELRARGIKTVIFTGDLYDQRRRVDSKITQFVEGLFEKELAEFECIVLQGNHDTYYKDDLAVTSLSNIWSKSNVQAITKITPKTILGKRFLFVPWLTTALEQSFIENVSKVSGKFDYLVGHFETLGFQYEAGNISTIGLDPELFYTNFKNTLSGHFHTQSYKEVNGNSIHYVGTPFQLTFGDIGETKGFIVLDIETNKREFIENTVSSKFVRFSGRAELSKYETFKRCFVELEYPEGTSDEELFIIEKEVLAKEPISYKAYLKVAKNIEDVISDKTPEEVKVFEDMSVAINSENMESMTKVFLEAQPYEDPEMVLELIVDIRAKITG
jgi:DNA repair exonuclease SbcCD nuclease subunit